jgi:hypothetical protein
MGGKCVSMWEQKIPYRVWVGKIKERTQLQDVGMDGRKIIKEILKE